MPSAAISTESLWRRIDTSLVVTYFLTGVIIGVLLGLVLAPVLRSWLLWQQAKVWDERDRNRNSRPTEHVH